MTKFISSIFIAMSAVFGMFAAGTRDPVHGGTLFAGVFLLVSGCSALNQFQEREVDGSYPRTMGRPLPSGKLSPYEALVWALFLLFGGLFLLAGFQKIAVVGIGFAGIILYNFGYTILKERSPFAIFPGAIAGCLPPLMGWVGGGGDLADKRLWIGLGFAYSWQIAHFGLLLLSYANEYAVSKTVNLYQVIGNRGSILMTAVSMFFSLFFAVWVCNWLPSNFPISLEIWIRWVQLGVVFVSIGFAIFEFQVRNRALFHIWNSWLGIALVLGCV